MRKYNELYRKFRSLDKLLAWMHARALEDALKVQPVPWALLDQFTKKPLVKQNLREVPKGFELRMRTKAESDPVVAAASIVARAEFVRQMHALSEHAGEPLLKGASAQVKAQATRLVEKFGPDALGDYAKLHFRTASEALGLPVPEKKPWVRR
jgi:ribonuclease HIII